MQPNNISIENQVTKKLGAYDFGYSKKCHDLKDSGIIVKSIGRNWCGAG